MQAIRFRPFTRSVACLLGFGMALLSGCTTTSLVLGAAGIATDTSITWEIVKHLHAKATEGDDIPCTRLDSVQRALNVRCGAFVPGSVIAAELRNARLQDCALAVAVRDPRLWPALPEFIEKGASPQSCSRSPLIELAQASTGQAALTRGSISPGSISPASPAQASISQASTSAQECPDFSTASPAVLRSLRWLAETDPRAIHHDVVRMLSCPSAVRAGLDASLSVWLAKGDLDPGKVAFGPFGALHPDYLDTSFSRALEARGQTARAGLNGYDGVRPRGFELALRSSQWAALDWWLTRVPELANRVPPVQGNQLPWVPLAKVLTPGFLTYPQSRSDTVEFLLARGANPAQKLPYDSGMTVVQYARSLKSPQLVLLDPPVKPTVVAGAQSAVVPGHQPVSR